MAFRTGIALVLAALAAVAIGNMYDMVFMNYTSTCPQGCAPWRSAGNATYQPIINAMWTNGTIPDYVG
jgi:hypothetical protein